MPLLIKHIFNFIIWLILKDDIYNARFVSENICFMLFLWFYLYNISYTGVYKFISFISYIKSPPFFIEESNSGTFSSFPKFFLWHPVEQSIYDLFSPQKDSLQWENKRRRNSCCLYFTLVYAFFSLLLLYWIE